MMRKTITPVYGVRVAKSGLSVILREKSQGGRIKVREKGHCV